jgi:putative endonuclease
MYFAYVLKSVEHDFFYKGHCNDLERRLAQHNSGMTISIKPYIPFKLIYFEEFQTEQQAMLREKYFKSAAGRRFLKQKLTPGFNTRLNESFGQARPDGPGRTGIE